MKRGMLLRDGTGKTQKIWRARRDLNPRPTAPEAGALSAELRARSPAYYSRARNGECEHGTGTHRALTGGQPERTPAGGHTPKTHPKTTLFIRLYATSRKFWDRF